MNVWLWLAAACWTLLAAATLRRVLTRMGYVFQVVVVWKKPTPRMPRPRPGNVVIPLQMSRAFYGVLQEGAVGIVRLESVGDGTQTLVVEQQAPQVP